MILKSSDIREIPVASMSQEKKTCTCLELTKYKIYTDLLLLLSLF